MNGQEVYETTKTSLWQKYRRLIFVSLLIILFAVTAYFAYQKYAQTEAALQEAKVITQKQAADVNALQNLLQESKQNAQMLADAVKQAQAGQKQPVVNFSVQAPTVEQAAQDVAKRINEKDSELPPEALTPSDRTITLPQQVKQPDGTQEWQVGVYKVNNYRNWEWSSGFGQHGGDRYIPLQLQRNFNKDAAFSYEHHFGGRESGWEIKYTVKTDKLFFLF